MRYLNLKKDVIRRIVLKRDNYNCTMCGVPNNSIVYLTKKGEPRICDDFVLKWAEINGYTIKKIVLKVVHIEPMSATSDIDNYLSMCFYCSDQYFKAYKKEARKILEKNMTKKKRAGIKCSSVNELAKLKNAQKQVEIILSEKISIIEIQEIIDLLKRMNIN